MAYTDPVDPVSEAMSDEDRGTAILVTVPEVVAMVTAGASTADVVNVRGTAASVVCPPPGRLSTVVIPDSAVGVGC